MAGVQTLYLDHVLETVIMILIVLQDLYVITMVLRHIALELRMIILLITATTLMHQQVHLQVSNPQYHHPPILLLPHVVMMK